MGGANRMIGEMTSGAAGLAGALVAASASARARQQDILHARREAHLDGREAVVAAKARRNAKARALLATMKRANAAK